MLENSLQGVLLLACITFLVTAFLGWISLDRPDRSARVWFGAYLAMGVSAAAAIPLSTFENTAVYLLGSIALTVAFLAFGFSLRLRQGSTSTLHDELMLAAGFVLALAVIQAYFAAQGIFLGRALTFAIGNSIAAAWAASQAINLTRSTSSRFASYLAVIFSIEAGVLFLRVPQLLLEIEMPIRSIGSDSGILIMIVGIALCSIIKSIPYFSLRFEEILARIERDTVLVREQARQLARKNADLASAIHAVPVACVVTRPNLQVLYMNNEARRLLNEFGEETSKFGIGQWLLGMDGMSPLSVAALRHAFLCTPQSPEVRLVELSVSGIDQDDAAAQWVFLLKPAAYSISAIDSIWRSLRRRPDRTLLLCDPQGMAISAQPAWADVIGHCAVFRNDEPSSDASGLDLFASLRKFSDDVTKLDRVEDEVKRGKGTSVLLRSASSMQLTVAYSPLRVDEGGMFMLVDLAWKPSAVAARSIGTTRKKVEQPVAPDEQAEPPLEIPPFLRK